VCEIEFYLVVNELILECSQGCYGRTDGSVTISFRNFVGEGIKILDFTSDKFINN
jgi:hypothetical protein